MRFNTITVFVIRGEDQILRPMAGIWTNENDPSIEKELKRINKGKPIGDMRHVVECTLSENLKIINS